MSLQLARSFCIGTPDGGFQLSLQSNCQPDHEGPVCFCLEINEWLRMANSGYNVN